MLKRYLLIHALLVLFGISALYGQINMTSMGLDCTDSLQKNRIRYFSYGSGGRNRLWDFSKRLWSKESSKVVFMKYTNNASFKGDALATFRSDEHNKAIITAFIWPQGTDEYNLLSTRSNICNLLGVHEYYGHYINHYHHKEGVLDATYFLQRNHYSWKKTTPQFKNYINSVIKQYAYE